MTGNVDRRKLFARLEGEGEAFQRLLTDYLRVATISAHGTGFAEGAEATRRVLAESGARLETFHAEGGPPVVVGSLESAADRPWVVLYNHYDVQPVDPREEWKSDPFEPTVRDGALFARGASDTRGNVVAGALAVRAARETFGELPVNVRFMVEGEEESGSPHLEALATAHPELFRGIGATIEATSRSPDGRPVVALGSKGVFSVELEVRTAAVDQHSSLAAVLPNAAWRLIEVLRSLRSPDGRVRIPGFAEAIAPPDPAMLRALRRNTFDPEIYKETYGVTEVFGGPNRYRRLKRAYYSPTCTINGFVSGYTGPGHKTVNPAVARASVDFRLLPEQSGVRVLELLKAHLAAEGFGDVRLTPHSGFAPASTRMDAPIAVATIAAAKEAYGLPPNVVPWSLGSSTTAYFARRGTPALAPPGVGHAGSRVHAPNENIRLADAPPAMKSMAALLLRLGAAGAGASSGSG